MFSREVFFGFQCILNCHRANGRDSALDCLVGLFFEKKPLHLVEKEFSKNADDMNKGQAAMKL